MQLLTLRGGTSAFALPAGVESRSLGLPEGPLRMRRETLPLMRAVRREVRRPHVLIAVDSFLSAFVFPAVPDLPVRRVAWEHFNLSTSLNMRSRRLARGVAAFLGRDVVTLTGQDAEAWRRAFPRARALIQAIPNPLPFAPLAANPYDPGSRIVLAVGRLDRQKGFDLLLESWSQVEADFPEWSLSIVGTGVEHAALTRQARQLGLRRWELREPTTRVEELYRAAGVYALSSRHEGLPMVLMESQAYGVPAVAFDCLSGPAELLESGGGERAFVEARRHEAGHILNRWG